MALSNYGELKTAVQQYLYNRTDLGDQIPVFISLAEKKIFRQLRCRFNEIGIEDTLPVTTEGGIGFELPDDFLEMKFLTVNDRPLERISDIDYLSRGRRDNAAGVPTQFARVLRDIKLWRPADSDYNYRFVYWQTQQDQLVEDSDTTEVLQFAPDLYLYAALIEAMPFLVKDDRLTTWQALFSQAMDEINFQTQEGEYAGSPVSVSNVYGESFRGNPTNWRY